jgi:hypothetical protein
VTAASDDDNCGHEHGHGHGHGHGECHDEREKPKHRHDQGVSSLAFRFEGEVALPRLEKWIQELMTTKAKDLYRYKGVIAMVGMDDQYVFQGVDELFEGEFMSPWAQGQRRISKFVLIGKDLDRELLTTQFNKCKVFPLRFKVGDIVEACVGEDQFEQARVVAMWNDGYPYRVSRLAPKPAAAAAAATTATKSRATCGCPTTRRTLSARARRRSPGPSAASTQVMAASVPFIIRGRAAGQLKKDISFALRRGTIAQVTTALDATRHVAKLW